MSDGEAAEAALASVKDVVVAWIDEAKALGRLCCHLRVIFKSQTA
jgi:hypothetical protein